MRFFRLMAIGVVLLLLLAGAILVTACAGSKGEQGPIGTDGVGIQNVVNNGDGTMTISLTNGSAYTTDNLTGPRGAPGEKGEKGDSGAQGIQGPPGPDMIVAMGYVRGDAIVYQGYNVTSCVFDAGPSWYEIALTGIDYNIWDYVTLITPAGYERFTADYLSLPGEGKLVVRVHDAAGNRTMGGFSFLVLARS
jgi:hypothetical protein